MANRETLLAALRAHGQEHVLQHWDALTEPQRVALARQVESLDLALLAALHAGGATRVDWAALARRATPPPAVRLADRLAGRPGALGIDPQEARRRGAEALDAGEVGILLVAGGQGSRLGFDHPKGMYPIGPVSNATLLQVHLEKGVALAARHGRAAPLYLMTSPVTDAEQRAFLDRHGRFGLPEDDLVPFCQGVMPAVDQATGRLLMKSRHELFLSPDGHGGAVAALAASGAIGHMRRRGVKRLFYLQVDNPLVPIGDAELVGYHLLAGSELTSMAVAKQAADEKLGNFGLIDGRLNVIEYSDMPDDVANQREPSGELRFWAGSIAVHVFEVDFLERMLSLKDALPFHVAHKKAPYVDARGEVVEPTEPNALKFERFIFDLLPQAQNPLVVEYAEHEVFAPLKNAPGAPKDTPEYVKRLMVDQHRGWLEAAGARVAPGTPVEVSPLFALDAQGVRARVEPGTRIEQPAYLR